MQPLEHLANSFNDLILDSTAENHEVTQLIASLDGKVKSLNLPSLHPSASNRRSRPHFAPRSFNKLTDIIDYLSQKQPSWYKLKKGMQATTPLPSRFRCQSPKHSPSHVSLPNQRGFEFSTLPRFTQHAPFVHSKSLSPEYKKGINERIKHNKNRIILYSKDNLAVQTELKVRGREALTLLNKINQQMIKKETTIQKQLKIEAKFKRIRFRAQREDYAHIGKALWMTIVCRGLLTWTLARIQHSKIANKVMRRNQKFWLLCARMVGKIRLRAQRFRQTRARKVLSSIFAPMFVLRWNQKRRRYVDSLVAVCEHCLTQDKMLQVVFQWKNKLLVVKKFARTAIAARKTRHAVLLTIWNQYNEQLALASNGKKLTIPYAVKIHYIRKFIKKSVDEYMERSRAYLSHLNRLKTDWEYKYDQERMKLLGKDIEIQKPVLNLFRRRADLYNYVVMADQNRLNWEKISGGLSPIKTLVLPVARPASQCSSRQGPEEGARESIAVGKTAKKRLKKTKNSPKARKRVRRRTKANQLASVQCLRLVCLMFIFGCVDFCSCSKTTVVLQCALDSMLKKGNSSLYYFFADNSNLYTLHTIFPHKLQYCSTHYYKNQLLTYSITTSMSKPDITIDYTDPQPSKTFYRSSPTQTETVQLINRLAIQKETREYRRGVIPRSSNFRVRWDICIMTLAVYNCISVPYQLAFTQHHRELAVSDIIDLSIDFFFVIDIFLNFRTSYIDFRTGAEVLNRTRIASHYAKTGKLLVDIAACAPISLIDLLVQANSTISLIKLLKITRILRLSRIIYYLRLQQIIKAPLRVCKLILYILCYLHMVANAWMILVSTEQNWTPPSYVLPDQTGFFDQRPMHQYIICMYSAIATLVGCQMLPYSQMTYLFCSVFIILGAMLFTYMLGEISMLVFSFREAMTQFTKTMDDFNSTMLSLKVDSGLQLEILDYFKVTYPLLTRREHWDKFHVIIPPSIMQEINLSLYGPVVTSQEIFKMFPKASAQILSELSILFVRPSEHLIEIGGESQHFYIIVEGSLTVEVEGLDHFDHTVRKLYRGSYCGEVGLIYNTRRTASVAAQQYCTIGCLGKDSFSEIMSEHKELEQSLRVRISEYNDPYKAEIRVRTRQKMMRKISYLACLDNLLLDSLFYSMKLHSFKDNTIVFEEGAKAERVYFVLKGQVMIYTNLYDFALRKRLSVRGPIRTSIVKQKSLDTLNRASQKRKSIKKALNPGKKAHLRLADLHRGSIICAYQAVFQSILNVHCFTTTKAKLLVLDSTQLEAAAKANIRVRMAINRIVNKYTHDCGLSSVCHPPEFDCIKYIPQPGLREKRYTRANDLWKNAALMIIMKNRKKNTRSFASFSFVLQKLKAIKAADDQNWKGIAEMIQNDELSFSVISVAAFLRSEELKDPVLRQFAALADDIGKHQKLINVRAAKFIKNGYRMERRQERLLVKMEEVNDIATLLLSYMKQSLQGVLRFRVVFGNLICQLVDLKTGLKYDLVFGTDIADKCKLFNGQV